MGALARIVVEATGKAKVEADIVEGAHGSEVLEKDLHVHQGRLGDGVGRCIP